VFPFRIDDYPGVHSANKAVKVKHLFVLWLRLGQPDAATSGTGYLSGQHQGPNHPGGFWEPCFASGSLVLLAIILAVGFATHQHGPSNDQHLAPQRYPCHP
jgi:hypothetical protein